MQGLTGDISKNVMTVERANMFATKFQDLYLDEANQVELHQIIPLLNKMTWNGINAKDNAKLFCYGDDL
jgi:hypothetical protein